jgi:hypothetical protein
LLYKQYVISNSYPYQEHYHLSCIVAPGEDFHGRIASKNFRLLPFRLAPVAARRRNVPTTALPITRIEASLHAPSGEVEFPILFMKPWENSYPRRYGQQPGGCRPTKAINTIIKIPNILLELEIHILIAD